MADPALVAAALTEAADTFTAYVGTVQAETVENESRWAAARANVVQILDERDAARAEVARLTQLLTPKPVPVPPPAPPAVPTAKVASVLGWATNYLLTTELDKRAQRLAWIRESGLGWVRVGMSRSAMETVPGVYVWGAFDNLVAAIKAACPGVRILVTIGWTPAFERPAGTTDKYPSDPAAFGRFVGAAVARYKADVHHWQVWNEPNIDMFLTGTSSSTFEANLQRYCSLFNAAESAAHAADPPCKVITAGLASATDRPDTSLPNNVSGGEWPAIDEERWWKRQLQLIPNADGYALHAYPVALLNRIEALHAMIVAAGRPAPVWVTEFGWSGIDPSVTAQADHFRRAVPLLSGLASRGIVGAAFVHELVRPWNKAAGTREGELCVITPDGTKRPAFGVLQAEAAKVLAVA